MIVILWWVFWQFVTVEGDKIWELNTNEVINHVCIHCMHILIRVEKFAFLVTVKKIYISYIACIFWSELKKFAFLVRVKKIYILWFEWKICWCLGSELGKCQILSRVGKFYPPELEKSWLQRKKSILANFFNSDFNF